MIKRVSAAALLAGGLLTAQAGAEQLTGKINGHTCAHSGHTCPVSLLDPHLALEPAFVLQQQDGEYFFLANVPRGTAARHALEKATVTGKVNRKLRTIKVETLSIGGTTVWSQAMADKARAEWEALVGGDG